MSTISDASKKIPLLSMALFVAMVSNCALAVAWPSMVTSIFSTILFLALVLVIFKTYPAFGIVILPLLIAHFSTMVSLNAIESGSYMKEIGTTGENSFASASYSLCSALLIFSAAVVFRIRQRQKPIVSGMGEEKGFVIDFLPPLVGLFIVLWLAKAGLVVGFPLFTGTDRFEFRRLNADILTLNFLNLKFPISVFLGIAAAASRIKSLRTFNRIIFACYLFLSFSFGDKFFNVLGSASIFAMPFLLKSPDELFKTFVKFSPLIFGVLCLVFSVTFSIYSGYGSLDFGQTLVKLGGRVAGQGQLWYVAVRDSSDLFHVDTKALLLNFWNIFSPTAADFAFKNRLAGFHFMEHYAPTSIYLSALRGEGTVTPTMVFEAYGLVSFGYSGLFFLIGASGGLLGLSLDWMARSMCGNNPFRALLPTFFVSSVLAFLFQGTFYIIFSIATVKMYGAFFAVQWAISLLSKNSSSGTLPKIAVGGSKHS